MKPSQVCTLALLFLVQSTAFADSFNQTNLVSDIPGKAAFTDTNLIDPWGMSFSGTSPIWVSDRGAGVSTLYSGTGVASSLIVAVPPGAPLGPTGQVFASGTNFRLNNNPVNFIFATLGGGIDAWNGGAGTTAVVMATTPGANYTGLALANNTLYAANFVAGGGINVFDSSFAPTTIPGAFTDPNLPAGYAPFNVQAINGNLYVEYAKETPGVPVSLPGGGGYVDVFDTNGNLLQRLASNGSLDAPWGVAVVPATGFGSFAPGDVLIGNFGSGEIAVFDPTGSFLGVLNDSSGNPIVNDSLWAIAFGNSSTKGALYFTAGINGGDDGLFGEIATPEPAAAGLAALGILGILGYASRRRPVRA